MSRSKNWYIRTMEYYTAERKEKLLPFMTAWMELESITVSEISQLMKEIPYDLTYRRNLMNEKNERVRARHLLDAATM